MPSRTEIDSQQRPPPFGLVQRDLDSDTSSIAVEGELDLATAPDLEALLDGALDAGRRVLVDLSETVFVDSKALRVLLDASRRLGACAGAGEKIGTDSGRLSTGAGGHIRAGAGETIGTGAEHTGARDREPRLAIVCTRPNVLRIFEFSGLESAFAIFPTLDDALAYTRRGHVASCAG